MALIWSSSITRGEFTENRLGQGKFRGDQRKTESKGIFLIWESQKQISMAPKETWKPMKADYELESMVPRPSSNDIFLKWFIDNLCNDFSLFVTTNNLAENQMGHILAKSWWYEMELFEYLLAQEIKCLKDNCHDVT